MNTIQAYTVRTANGSDTVVKSPNDQTIAGKPTIAAAILDEDHYSTTIANDAVVAKVISSSINNSFDKSSANQEFASSEKLNAKSTTEDLNNVPKVFNIDTVTANVVGFVENALSSLATRGYDQEQLTFFRDEAVTGVEVGIDQAKIELIGLSSEALFTTIDKTKDSIIGGINQLAVNPLEYKHSLQNGETGTQRELASVEVISANKEAMKIDFESRAFNDSKTNGNRSLFTTSSSNISFAVQGGQEDDSQQQLANFVNKVDGLVNSFYRGNAESAYNSSRDLGYSDSEILSLAKQHNKANATTQMKTYGEIQHINTKENLTDSVAIKAVTEYVNRYLDVMESSSNTLNSKQDFNQVLNGLVNQMKDVQVPDLLQAINRFHAFNKKFM